MSPPSCSCASSAAACSASKSVTSTAYAMPSIEPATSSARVLVDVDDRDPRTLGGHAPAGRGADPRRAAGDERALTVEQTHRGERYRADRAADRRPRAILMSLPGRLAQLVEHLHDAQEVRRSSRLPPTDTQLTHELDRESAVTCAPRWHRGRYAFARRDRRPSELDGRAVPASGVGCARDRRRAHRARAALRAAVDRAEGRLASLLDRRRPSSGSCTTARRSSTATSTGCACKLFGQTVPGRATARPADAPAE